MLNMAAAVGLCIGIASAAGAQVIPSVVESFPAGLPAGARSWDIVVDMAAGDGLPRYNIVGETIRGRFLDPDPAQGIYQLGGPLADSWFTSVSAPPNPPVPGGANEAVTVITPDIRPTSLIVSIFNFGIQPGAGRYIIGRVIAESDAEFTLAVGISSVFQPVLQNFTISVPPPEPCPGDANGDGAINGSDLSVLLGQFGLSTAPGSGADFNGDGVVDAADLSVLLARFGLGC